MPLSLAAAIFTVLIAGMGVIYYKYEKQTGIIKKMEKLLANSSRELASMELLKSRFLSRIGEVLLSPLKTIETAAKRLIGVDAGIPESILDDLQNLSEEVRSLIRIMSVFEEISSGEDDKSGEFLRAKRTERVQMDDIVSEAAMDIAEDAAVKLVSMSVAICGSVNVSGRKAQLSETVSSIFRETLKRADPGTVMGIELRVDNDMELESKWESKEHRQVSEEQDLLGAGFIRLVASSHGGWLNVDIEHGSITLILPIAGDNR
ncbi:MAG: hypothetical protein J7K88_03980 [Candidatus Fermentibacteraceae bacterium]|nr:hypothetical protein [Candidatus Fermentibacteraceae bacterium]